MRQTRYLISAKGFRRFRKGLSGCGVNSQPLTHKHSSPRPGTNVGLLVLVVTIVINASRPEHACARDAKDPVGVIVGLSGVDAGPLVGELRGGANAVRWRGMSIEPAALGEKDALLSRLKRLREAYFNADFVGCLRILRQPNMSASRLVRSNKNFSALSAAQTLRAACAHGADDIDLARSVIAEALVWELDLQKELGHLRPDFQQLVESVRAKVLAGRRLSVRIDTRPKGARLKVDGRFRCSKTPCTLKLWAGEHLITAEKLGFGRRIARKRLGKAVRRLDLALDPVDASEARRQLSQLVPTEKLASRRVGQLAARAANAPIVVMVWRVRKTSYAATYDRRTDQIVGRVAVVGKQKSSARAMRASIEEWRNEQPTPIYKRPILYIGIVGAAATAAVISYFALRSGDTRHDVVFP